MIRNFFAPNQWVEIIGEEEELKGIPGSLARLIGGTSAARLVFDPATVVGKAISLDNFPLEQKPKVRRWDNVKSAEIPINTDWIELEAGIKVQFFDKYNDENVFYNTGDYWLIPARASNQNIIEWTGNKPQLARGIKHYYSQLAFLQFKDNDLTIEDYRQTFPSLVNCLDKNGGALSGDLEIKANVFVTGKQHKGEEIPGVVGIGTKTPFAKLHVENHAFSKGMGLISSQNLDVTGNQTDFNKQLRVGHTITANNQTKIITY
ncbi:MAG: hypothetical protein HC908_16420, partial [Calothrix sp. SM1_7_51]|nr:hypothetical protein [Calothrix sp. SM1_7_51]